MNRDIDTSISALFSGTRQIMGNRSFFTCVYGSIASGRNTPTSDIDFVVATDEVIPTETAALGAFALEFHSQRGLGIDQEVPYANKLAVSFKDLRAATRLQGLELNKGRIKVPEVIKTADFLNSRAIKLRLLFNALTVPHRVDNRDHQVYREAKSAAEENLFLLALDLADQRGVPVNTASSLLQVLLEDGNGNDGELYLGYKPHDAVIENLTDILETQLQRFNVSRVLYVNALLSLIPNLFT